MRKIVIVCGLLAGLIVSAVTVISIAACYSTGEFEGNVLIGYATMLFAFSLIFIGIKNYRDKYNNGIISFGKAFTIGLYISLVASTIYVIVWLFDYYLFVPDFMDKYADHMVKQIRLEGASQVEIDEKVAEMASFKEMYKSPVMIVLLTYGEILPIGLLVTLISALILKRKKKVQAQVS